MINLIFKTFGCFLTMIFVVLFVYFTWPFGLLIIVLLLPAYSGGR